VYALENCHWYGEPCFAGVTSSHSVQAYVIIVLMSALWKVNLMLGLNGLFFCNRYYTLINVLKALTSIISICNLHLIFQSKVTP
jgi:hypothetical protein